ncbi:hypothetical protein CL673_09280 [Candidatus Bathyarchaeota archaeon]|jgi:hypothetical protein|nr:hypothetical protein [Candidatus Bathyarchaeota archaeon]|tara:strand:+ start:2508 stop:3329 length:822 start_codon:yes stop_codon:yes gene_type:complete
MIICGHSTVEPTEEGWRVLIEERVGNALSFFPGQTLFGVEDKGSKRLFISSLKLTPRTIYYRVFLEDIRGSLASMTSLFSEKRVNILSGGAFGFGNIWVSEFIADFQGVDSDPDSVAEEIEEMGGFVASREITELFPRAFDLIETYRIEGSKEEKLYLLLPELSGRTTGPRSHVILKAWPRIQALFIDFYPEGEKLVKITAKLNDVPGSLNKLAGLIGTQVNLNALDELHHEESAGVWTSYGNLVVGTLKELREKAEEMANIFTFDVEPLGWK